MQLLQSRNSKVVVAALVPVGVMIGLVSYSPTLYRLYCAATGYGGTTQRVDANHATISDRTIMVQFDTNVASDLPWHFKPEQREVKVLLGEQKLVFFAAENLSAKSIVGHASFNVTPGTVGLYFNKIQCFCFNEEKLGPHERVDMPVVFYVDPAMLNDSDTRDTDTITLSYTFFRSAKPEDAKDLARFAGADKPDTQHGEQLFSERCAACHALDANRAGPMLGGVFSRKAGAAPGYPYSTALRNSGLTWSAANLDRWLAGPTSFVVGVKMPVQVPSPIDRRDIIGYLRNETRERNVSSPSDQPVASGG